VGAHNSHAERECWTISIRGPIPSISPGFYGWIGQGGRLAWYQSRGPGFNPTHPRINSVMCNNSHLPCCSLGTHMARAYGLDSHTEGGMLDHKIRSPPSLPYHLDFMVGFDRGASSMVQQKHFTKFSVNFTQIYYISNKNSPTRGGRGVTSELYWRCQWR
jgi:hypothetical protein